jgi:hypothetical protein
MADTKTKITMLTKAILLGIAIALLTTVLTTGLILALGITIKTYAVFLYIPAIMLTVISIAPMICSKGDERLFIFFEHQREAQKLKYQKVLDKMIIRKKAARFMLILALVLSASGFSLNQWVGI